MGQPNMGMGMQPNMGMGMQPNVGMGMGQPMMMGQQGGWQQQPMGGGYPQQAMMGGYMPMQQQVPMQSVSDQLTCENLLHSCLSWVE